MGDEKKWRIFATATACNESFGSESAVGYAILRGLAAKYSCYAVTSKGMNRPDNMDGHTVSVKFDDANDVGLWQLMKFELLARAHYRKFSSNQKFEILHRVTPSGWKPTLTKPMPNVKTVVGPILLSKEPPPSFHPIFNPPVHLGLGNRLGLKRWQHAFARRFFDYFGNPLLEQADLILAGSPTTERMLDTSLKSRCRLIPYSAVEHDQFTPARNPAHNAIIKLLFVGRLVSYKGIELLLRAFARAIAITPMKLDIVGNGQPEVVAYYKSIAEQLGILDHVRFQPAVPRPQLKQFYQSCDIYCLPSIETYGLSLLEAMSCGCCVLVADINGPGDIVHSNCGRKVKLATPEQFIADYATELVELAGDAQARKRLGEAAREYIIEHHDLPSVTSQLLQHYDDLVRPESSSFE